MHYAEDAEDFQARLERLDGQDLGYLAGRILDGSECLLCISPEFAGIFIDMLEEKMPGEDAEKIRALYKSSTGYDAEALLTREINERRFDSFRGRGFDHIALQDAA